MMASIGLLFLAGCEAEQNVPTAEQFAEERGKLQARVEARKAKTAKNKGAAPVATAKAAAPVQSTFAGGPEGFDYDPEGRRDPFRSFEWERLALENDDSLRGPLEQFDVSQLSVVAVVWNSGGGRALVEDPSGQGYIVEMGTPIGKNDGSVVRIDDNLVVVKETYVDFLGHESKKDVELRIRSSEGG